MCSGTAALASRGRMKSSDGVTPGARLHRRVEPLSKSKFSLFLGIQKADSWCWIQLEILR